MSDNVAKGFSAQSGGAAVGNAIGMAHSQSGRTHMVLLSVVAVAGGWVASVLIVSEPEPKLESILEKRLEQKHYDEEYERTHPSEKQKGEKLQEYNMEQHISDTIHLYISSDMEDELLEEMAVLKEDFADTYEKDLHYHFQKNIGEIFLDYDFHLAVLSDEPEPIIQGDARTPKTLNKEPELRNEPNRQYNKNRALLERLELDG